MSHITLNYNYTCAILIKGGKLKNNGLKTISKSHLTPHQVQSENVYS